MAEGFGQVGFGRSEFGQAKSDVEPRLGSSDPEDEATGISIFYYTIKHAIYGFSSRVQLDNSLLIEVSENGGSSYADAYKNGAFVAPYNGSNSSVDAHQADPQALRMSIHKTSTWADEQEIRVRVTAYDEYGQLATKTTPVEWPPLDFGDYR